MHDQDMQLDEVSSFNTLLKDMVSDDRQTVGQLPLLSKAERQTVLYDWNATATDYPKHLCVHELFEAQAAKTPHSIAVEHGEQRLSYSDLNAQANRLAHYLRQLGVAPDVRVGICVERSLNMLIGLLGILKAGGAYVALDPSYPRERLGYMLTDSQPLVLLTDAETEAQLIELAAGLTCINLSAEIQPWQAMSCANLDPHQTSQSAKQLAYVIYTSGSTGKPKGVEMPHSALINLVVWQVSAGQNQAPLRTLQYSPINFDVSFQEMFATWFSGGVLVLVDNLTRRDPYLLLQFLDNQRIERLFLPFIALDQLSTAATERGFPPKSLLELITAGEQLRINATIKSFIAGLNDCRLENQYGPSETHVVTAYRLPSDLNAWGQLPPIGRPIANTQIYILDSQGQPAPIGITGELHIGGAGVARGYLNRPELTSERFLDDPFSQQPHARMYKTGDMGRWLADGNIEFLGRNDHQVKIRGFRIELGEIETTLLQHPGVREAVVLAREEGGDKRLVAYYCGEKEQGAEVLRAHLGASLPDYMVPAAYVQLDTLPLTPNGKLDRKALPAPTGADYIVRGYEAPIGQIERTVALIWAELLKVERVGRNDNFFDLGGYSLLAVQAVSRLRRGLGVEAPIERVFALPVLADFAGSLQSAVASELPPIQPVVRTGRLALSFAQQRLWFLAQMKGGSLAYHIPMALRLIGQLDAAALRQALDRIVARHEALRTTFVQVGVEPPEQRLNAVDCGFSLIELDLRGQADSVAELTQWLEREARDEFDFVQGPLLRGRLLRLADHESVLLLTQHHIISDGWSIGVLLNELQVLYTAFLQGDADPLPPLPVQYIDYAAWERQWLDANRLAEQAAYWKSALVGAPMLLELPTDYPRPAQQNNRGSQISVVLDAELTAQLKALSVRHGVTLFVTLLTGWGLLLARLSGQDEVVIGTPTANRGCEEIERLIGFFVNTLALRIDVSDAPSVAELLDRVKSQVLEALAHQDMPFEQVVEIIQPPRSLAYAPLFQVMFAWQNTPQCELELPGLCVSTVDSLHRTAKFDLVLSLEDAGVNIVGGLEYASALFEPATVQRYLGYWISLLKAMISDDRQTVGQLPLLSKAERQTVLYDWNATATDYPKHLCVHELFEAQAAKTPHSIAVEHGEQQLSYGELNAQANRLAHYLRQLGVAPDVRVGICVERSLNLIIGLLAILKAGGAYVPLDVGYPAERLKRILANSAPIAILTQTSTAERLSAVIEHLPCINLSANATLWASQSGVNLTRGETGQTSEQLAYIIYTSGSTGIPKGVMVPHRAIGRLVLNNGYLQIEVNDSVALAANPAFDACTFEVWAPLLNGGRIVVIDESAVLEAERFNEILKRYQISILWLTVGLFNQYVVRSAVDFRRLRYLLVGGDKLDPRSIAKVLRHAPPQHLLNGYGPTETTTFATTYEITDCKDENSSIPIGRPIANTTVYILDRYVQPVPIGVRGELYIGGDGVALGYLNDPALTAERFLIDPFSQQPHARMYKTGDMGRWLADGNIEFLGRNDYQVKIRGFRIELGEIETALAQHPAVYEAVVLAREENGDKRLVAYYCAEVELGAGVLRAHLGASLPDYMVPAAYVFLDTLPLTPNGKLDRKALPAPTNTAYALQDFLAPQNDTEETLAVIWAEQLEIENIGRHDNFFDLGGHSLSAIMLLAQINRVFQVNLPLVTIFNAPTVAQIAELLLVKEKPITWFSLFPIQKTGSKPILFWIDYTARENHELVKQLDADQPVYGLRYGIGSSPGQRMTLPPMEEWAAHYIKEIKSLQPKGPYFLIGHCYGGILAYEIAQQLIESGERVGELFLVDAPPRSAQKRLPMWTILENLNEISLSELRVKILNFLKAEAINKRQRLLNLLNRQTFRADQLNEDIWTLVPPILNKYHRKKYSGHAIFLQSMITKDSLIYGKESPEVEWRKLVSGSLECHAIHGDHHSMLTGLGANQIAQLINQAMHK
jgi:amino acid adenylation domain-containing protein